MKKTKHENDSYLYCYEKLQRKNNIPTKRLQKGNKEDESRDCLPKMISIEIYYMIPNHRGRRYFYELKNKLKKISTTDFTCYSQFRVILLETLNLERQFIQYFLPKFIENYKHLIVSEYNTLIKDTFRVCCKWIKIIKTKEWKISKNELMINNDDFMHKTNYEIIKELNKKLTNENINLSTFIQKQESILN